MNRDQGATENLLDRENKLIAEVLANYRTLIRASTEKVTSTASTGEAAANMMTIQVTKAALVKSIEELLGLTRKIRELWVIGPLKNPGEGDQEAQQGVRKDATDYTKLLDAIRKLELAKMVNASKGSMILKEGPPEGDPSSASIGIKQEPGAATNAQR